MIAMRRKAGVVPADRQEAESPPLSTAPGNEHRAWEREVLLTARDDPQAFAPIYHSYFDAIHGYCLRRIRDRHDAADATSQIFINAMHALAAGRFDPANPKTNFRSWLFSIAHNVVVDVYRKRRPTVSLDRDVGDRKSDLSSRVLWDTAPSLEDRVIAQDAGEALLDALEHLPERQRTVIELRLADLSHAEIAGVLGLSATAIRSAQFRGISALRAMLNSGTGQGDSGEVTHG
jgi:RNA polymerase sigma-70 factor (ECF subfamily)